MKYKEQLNEHVVPKVPHLREFLYNFLGYSEQWGASTKSFGKNSKILADQITEQDLIKEMTDSKKSLKKLLNASGGDLSAVKPFLPAIMISLKTNTRDNSKMQYKHTGEFCFDFDKFKDTEEALFWMKKVYEGTINIKPYFSFISPRGKGFKIFCKIDTSSTDFKNDFQSEDPEVVKQHHKVFYEGAIKEIYSKFPALKKYIDTKTNDPTRITYIPFIADKVNGFNYDPNRISNYSKIVKQERKLLHKKLKRDIAKNQKEINRIMKEQGISSQEEAYYVFQKKKTIAFDLESETEKFEKVIEFLEELSNKDSVVEQFVSEHFDNYGTLQKLCWVLFGVFGELAVDNLLKLVPEGSNKKDENHGDYRWTVRSKDDYSNKELKSLLPAPFYAIVRKLEEVDDFIYENFGLSNTDKTEIKLLSDYYDTYVRNVNLEAAGDDQADTVEFLDDITYYMDKKKMRLPLIEELESITSELTLGPNDYLDKNVMHNLFQNKYSDKRIFFLRSQCGTGKNSITGNHKYKMPGRILLCSPYTSIINQAAYDAWHSNDKGAKLFAHSTIVTVIESLKKSDDESIPFNYAKTLKGKDLSKDKELVVFTTYNQLLNMTFEELATLEYIVIDESHSLSDGLGYRADTIAEVIHYLIEFVRRKAKAKTKIIFMSGTPNVETHVVQDLMQEHKLDHLYQRIIINKKYKHKPTIHLTHLDTNNSEQRSDAVIRQIHKYYKQGRKVVHIFNFKDKMDKYIREIQSKLSSDIKVGLFYSGSDGECTSNILEGKFGDYDVILTTTYFINGININRDGISEADFLAGKSSTQEYGVVIDLGKTHTKINASDAVQAINRFRNRKCHTTVFFPKMFRTDQNNSTRKFDYNYSGRVILGINKYNNHLLSINKNLKEVTKPDKETEEQMFLLDEIRNNPDEVRYSDIVEHQKKSESRQDIINRLEKKKCIYEDWLCSLDGYHFIAKDAGFLSIIKNSYITEPLPKMTEDQIELRNKVIRNFLDDEIALMYLYRHLDKDKRIIVKASSVIKDPLSSKTGNFSVDDFKNKKYIVIGDFHVSHERAINKLIIHHLQLSYWYGPDKAIEILRNLVNPEVKLLPINTECYLKKITNYLKSYKAFQKFDCIDGMNYIKIYNYLADKNLGIEKKIFPTYISYTNTNPELDFKEIWALMQKEKTSYLLNYSNSLDKKHLKEHTKNDVLMKKIDLENINSQLDRLSIYKPLKYSKSGDIKSYESITIPRILRSDKLMLALNDYEYNAKEPENCTYEESMIEFENVWNKLEVRLDTYISPKLRSNHIHLNEIYNSLKELINQKNFQKSSNYIDILLNDPKKKSLPEVAEVLQKLKKDLKNIDTFLLAACKAVDYNTYKNLNQKIPMKFITQTLFCEEDFQLATLNKRFKANLKEINHYDVYDILYNTSKKYIESTRLSVRTPEGRITITSSNPKASKITKPAYLIIDHNGKLIYADFSPEESCKYLCSHAFSHNGFVMKDGSMPAKNYNKGIYNPMTFLNDYFVNSTDSCTVSNYNIKVYDINLLDYRNFADAKKRKKKKSKK